MELRPGVVCVLKPDNTVSGTGFLLTLGRAESDPGRQAASGDPQEVVIVTCAHVIGKARGEAGGTVSFIFAHGREPGEANIVHEWWSDDEDVAILRLCPKTPLPPGAVPLPLGSAAHSRGHSFESWGYRHPEQYLAGLSAEGKIAAPVSDSKGRARLQLQTVQIEEGMSGAPLWDRQTRRVVGMISSHWETPRTVDADLASAIPSETLVRICPRLRPSELRPYRGLGAFTEADEEFFCGRKPVVDSLLAHLRRETRFMAVLGPSGSGKSSVVQAGLIPQLRRGGVPGSDRWGIIFARPGDHPFAELSNSGLAGAQDGLTAAVEAWLAQNDDRTRLCLVLDQFEDVLGACLKQKECHRFVTELTDLLNAPPPVTVVLVMRDDYYSRLGEVAPKLHARLGEGALTQIFASLDEKELRTIVEEPARTVGLTFEPGLAETIVNDAMAATSRSEDPNKTVSAAVLPLLEFALDRLWEERTDGQLTFEAYSRLGRVIGGLAQGADDAYAAVPENLQLLARYVLTDLVQPGDPAVPLPDSRRRATISGLASGEEEREAVSQVVEQLASARLLITARPGHGGPETVEIIHDALLREWGQLRRWLETDREFLTWLRETEHSANAWRPAAPDRPSRHNSGRLLRDRDLAEARAQLRQHKSRVNPAVKEFIAASWRSHLIQLSRAVTVLGAIVAVVVASLIAFGRYQKSSLAHHLVEDAQIEQGKPGGFPLSVLLAREAVERYDQLRQPTAAAERVLRDGLDKLPQPLACLSHGGRVARLALAPAGATTGAVGELLATGCDNGQIWLWSLANGQRKEQAGDQSLLDTLPEPVTAVALSPSGRFLAAGCDNAETYVWDTSRPESGHLANERRSLPRGAPDEADPQPISAIAFRPPASHQLAAGCKDGTVRLWDVESPKLLRSLPARARKGVVGLAFSPDGKYLAVGYEDGAVWLWAVDSQIWAWPGRRGHSTTVTALAFDSSGQYLATGSEDGTLMVWKVSDGHPSGPYRNPKAIRDVAWRPVGSRAQLATASDDGSAQLWSFSAGTGATSERAFIGHAGPIYKVAFSPDGELLATASADKTARVWDVESGHETWRMTHGDIVRCVVFSGDGKRVITGSDDKTAVVWTRPAGSEVFEKDGGLLFAANPAGADLATGPEAGSTLTVRHLDGELAQHSLSPRTASVTAMAYSLDGAHLAILDSHAVRLYKANSDQNPIWWQPLQHPLAQQLAFSGDSRRVAVASGPDLPAAGKAPFSIRVCDAADGRAPKEIGCSQPVTNLRLSQTGAYLAAVAHADSSDTASPVLCGKVATGDLEPIRVPLQAVVIAVEFSPHDDGVIAVAESGGLISLWDVATMKIIRSIIVPKQVRNIAFRPNGRVLAIAADSGTYLWSVDGDSISQPFLDPGEGRVRGVAFDSTGSFVASAGSDGWVRVREVATGRQMAQVHPDSVSTVGFADDSRYLITSDDTWVRVWRWRLDDLVKGSSGFLLRGLTDDERKEYLGGGPALPCKCLPCR